MGIKKIGASFGIDASQPQQEGLPESPLRRTEPAPDAGDTARATAWLDENWQAIEYYNAYVEEHGLPLDEFRQF
jgi:hypothetical protein